MQRKFDVIIVGGGPGGLSIGSLLAQEGVSSGIIEKAPVLGGRYRSVQFHGCRLDSGAHALTGMVASPEETSVAKFLSYLGIPVEYKTVDWNMGLVSRDKPNRIDFFTMNPKLGVDNFFEFFAFASGTALEDRTKQELKRAFNIMEDMSEEEMRNSTNVDFASWIDRNVEDPMAQAVLHQAPILAGAAATEMNFGQFANVFGAFPRVGALSFGYPKHGTLEDAVIAPLTKYYTDHGGEVFTNKTATSISIRDGEAKGVVARDNPTLFLEEFSAPVVICAIPVFEAVSRNVLRSEFLTRDWSEAIQRCARLAYNDLSGFYLLREEVMPRGIPEWVHLFDADYGVPTYVGDWWLGSFCNAVVPPGKQLVCSYIPGGLEATHFGLTSPMEKVWEANNRFKDVVEKVSPGFAESIEFEGLNLQLNWGRYAWAVVPTEIDIQSPNIKGLYFAGDSVRSIGSMASDKIYQMAFPLCERILKYVRP